MLCLFTGQFDLADSAPVILQLTRSITAVDTTSCNLLKFASVN